VKIDLNAKSLKTTIFFDFIMKVTLRQRKKGDKISLYLDYYNNGKREYEYLKLYLIPEPEKGKLTKTQKDENSKILSLAESIRSKRHLEIQNGIYGFSDKEKLKGHFIAYMNTLAQKKLESKGNYDNWDSSIKHLRKYAPKDILFSQLDKKFVEGFREYLTKTAITPANKPLSTNSACSYFNKFRAALKQAVKDGIIRVNPAENVESIPQGDNEREFLTYEELQSVAKHECEIPIMKTAFIFSSLTGLRWSDINKLVWSEIQYSENNGWYIRFRQQKTKSTETLPISELAYKLLGDVGKPDERVFKGLKYSAWHNLKLQQWIMKAGISKTISFHCARHTYATLQLTLGTDIFTVSKMLGHKDIRTTQVYAKIVDEKKREAANKIKLEL
jgi:integrase